MEKFKCLFEEKKNLIRMCNETLLERENKSQKNNKKPAIRKHSKLWEKINIYFIL